MPTKATHKCKFNPNENLNLPLCTWKSNRCHSPCDLIAQSPSRPQSGIIIETPDDPYPKQD